MKSCLFIMFLLFAICLKSQTATKVYVKNNNIYVQFDDASAKQITNKKIDSNPILSNDRKNIYFLRTKLNNKKAEEGEEIYNESQIIVYDLSLNKENILVQGCNSYGKGSSKFSYSESNEYPFSELCNIKNIFLSPDDQRIYFETSAWTVSSAIHYYNILTKKIAFFYSGNIIKVLSNGELIISITSIEENKGRYIQNWLFDKYGTKIKAIGEKEF